MDQTFILIPGRTSDQGCGISEGKDLERYQREINTLQMAPEDIERLGITEDQKVRVRSDYGEIEIAVKAAKKSELPPGILFMAYGDLSCRLMGADTHGTGMPTSKGLDVAIEVPGKA